MCGSFEPVWWRIKCEEKGKKWVINGACEWRKIVGVIAHVRGCKRPLLRAQMAGDGDDMVASMRKMKTIGGQRSLVIAREREWEEEADKAAPRVSEVGWRGLRGEKWARRKRGKK